MRRGNIDLNPRFQRREVWQPQRKSRFIESLLLNLPIPQVVLAEKRGERGRYVVLDGKQRLLTLRQFCAEPGEHEEDVPFQQLSLTKLQLRSDLDGKSYKDLREEPGYADDRDAFDNSTIRTVVVRNWPTDDYLFLVFLRLNTESVALSPQELRQALKPGRFTDFVDERAVASDVLKSALNQSGADFRMRDTEILLRALAFQLRPESYAGNLKAFLDDTCEHFNNTWQSDAAIISTTVDNVERAIAAAISIFGERVAFSRYTNGIPERRFNRAIFDVMVHSLSQPRVMDAALSNPSSVVECLQELCEGDSEFVTAITSTTKSITATARRFVQWADALEGALMVPVDVPADYASRVRAS
ncbi:hypothetical protein CCO04_18890 [Pimelobacter sp. 30-1]|nr:hypothetical protein [Pimelobacter sp. 30-1]